MDDATTNDATADDATAADATSDDGSDGATTPACPPGLTSLGCAVLSVPLSGSGQSAHFLVTLNPEIDFTGATITAQVIAPGATSGVLQAYVQHGPTYADGASAGYSPSFIGWQNLSSAQTAWTTETWMVKSSGFDNTSIQRLGMSVESGSATDASTFEQPDTVVYIGSITVTTASGTIYSISFDTSTTVAPTQQYPAANVMWLNNGDGPLAGSTLAWLPAP